MPEVTQQTHGSYRPQTHVLLGLRPVLEIIPTAGSPKACPEAAYRAKSLPDGKSEKVASPMWLKDSPSLLPSVLPTEGCRQKTGG